VLEAVARGTPLELDGTVIEDAASFALPLPADEQMALLFQWSKTEELFGTTRLRLEAAGGATCAYDPASNIPNPLGMRAFVTVEEREGDTVFVYEQFRRRWQVPPSQQMPSNGS